MRLLIVLAMLAALVAGCTPSAETVDMPVMPKELDGCKVFRVSDGSMLLYIVRCPGVQTVTTNWRTTSSTGKTTTSIPHATATVEAAK